MPQLDVLTFYSQAITLLFIFVVLFVFSVTFFLPEIYKAKKVRWFIQSRANKASLPTFLVNLYGFRLSAIICSCNEVAEKIAQLEIETVTPVSETVRTGLTEDEEDDLIILEALQDLTLIESYIIQDEHFLIDYDNEIGDDDD